MQSTHSTDGLPPVAPNADPRHASAAGASGAATAHGHNAVREGVVAGLIGGTAVALWFLMVDFLAGRPLFTPAFLGTVVGGEADATLAEGSRRLAWAAVYTPIHYLMFCILGVIAVVAVHKAARTPAIVGLFLMLVLAVAVAFTGLVAVLERSALGTLAWSQIAAGSVVGVLAMGWYLYRRHRGVGHAWAGQASAGG